MHEFHQAGLLVKKIEEVLADSPESRVREIRLRIGPLFELTPDHLRGHFEKCALGTRAEGADLVVSVSEDSIAPRGQEVLLESLTIED
jgi:Zn finger protein HypA/HybF involved in hydrogenase expression